MSETFSWEPFEGDRWSPENVDDTIVGTVIGIRVESGKAGDVPVVTLQTDDGDKKEVWASPTMLKQALATEKPQQGDKLAIKLTELRQVGQPSPLKVFAVKVKRAEPQPDPETDAF